MKLLSETRRLDLFPYEIVNHNYYHTRAVFVCFGGWTASKSRRDVESMRVIQEGAFLNGSYVNNFVEAMNSNYVQNLLNK